MSLAQNLSYGCNQATGEWELSLRGSGEAGESFPRSLRVCGQTSVPLPHGPFYRVAS